MLKPTNFRVMWEIKEISAGHGMRLTVFHGPYDSGISLKGAPVPSIRRMAFAISLSHLAGRPLLPVSGEDDPLSHLRPKRLISDYI